MPNRILRDWTDSEPVNSLSWQAECLFIRLIMKADDYGCFHGNAKLLKSLLFPLKDGLRDSDIARWIAECETSGLIRTYSSEGKPFIEIRKYGQRLKSSRHKFPVPPMETEQDPPAPPPPEDDTDSGKFREVPGSSGKFRGEENRDGDENKENPPAGDKEKPAPAFELPHSIDEIVKLAGHPWCAKKCTKEQAEAYFTDRVARDWIPYGQNKKIGSLAQICADLKKWLMRDQNEIKERKTRNGNDTRFINNESSSYDESDDGSNI